MNIDPVNANPGPAHPGNAKPLKSASGRGDRLDFDQVDMDLIDAEADVAPSRPPRNRVLPVMIISALLGAAAGGAVVYLALMKPSALQPSRAVKPTLPVSAPAPVNSGKQGAAGREWSSALAAARHDIAAGRLREAQEDYLSILLIEPAHDEAMRGLVRVVGLIAKGDRAALRRQAEAYRRAIALGVETEEHYTAPAMELLARASLKAAGVRVTSVAQEGPPPAPSPRPSAAPSRPSPGPSPANPSPPSTRPPRRTAAPPPPRPQPPAPAEPTPSPQLPAAQPAPPPPAAVNVNEPFVTVVIGPFGSSERASAVTGELTISGYAARVRRQGEGSYLITLGPYRKSEAERAAAFVRSRFGSGVPVAFSLAP